MKHEIRVSYSVMMVYLVRKRVVRASAYTSRRQRLVGMKQDMAQGLGIEA